ncbi:MAG: hypothetical protein H0U75_07675 [Legionella sp.]|nr:hypothetical protein [Legionella sp.]
MPTLDELTNKSKRKFTKSEYRPWNYMEELDKESNRPPIEIKEESSDPHIEINKESVGNQLSINKKEKQDPSIDVNKAGKVTLIPIKEKQADNNLIDVETTLDIIFRLTGHQKKIFIFIVDRCMSRAMLTTGVVKGEILVGITGTTIKMVKTSIQRLIEKNLIIRERGKTGRGGFYSFRIIELVRNATIEYKRMLGIGNQLGIKEESNSIQLEVEKRISPGKKNKIFLPAEWENINISPLDGIGFNHNHLSDIFETGLSEFQMVQDSILHFAFGIEHEPSKYKQYDDLLNVLVGRLRKGKPWYEPNYRSPQELAQQKFMENKKNEMERKKLLQEEAYKIALAEWQQDLSQSELDKIIPTKKVSGDITPQAARLSLYFKENIWPEKKSEYLVEG